MEFKQQYYRRGQCPVCRKTAERQLLMTTEEFRQWEQQPVRHKRCEGFCKHCGMKIVTPEQLEEDPWAGCTGIETLQVDPYMAEIEDDYTEVMLCHGRWQIRSDDI